MSAVTGGDCASVVPCAGSPARRSSPRTLRNSASDDGQVRENSTGVRAYLIELHQTSCAEN